MTPAGRHAMPCHVLRQYNTVANMSHCDTLALAMQRDTFCVLCVDTNTNKTIPKTNIKQIQTLLNPSQTKALRFWCKLFLHFFALCVLTGANNALM